METEKRDFENLEVRLYLALKAVLNPRVSGPTGLADEENALAVLKDFEDSRGPLPDWAIGRNWGYELIPGAQLMTKDGRVSGNAHILRVGEGIAAGPAFVPTFDCITDAGSYIKSMTEQELLNQFWVGDFISDPKTLIARFGNHGEDYGLPEMP